MDTSDSTKDSFMKHVFYFDDQSKSDILNLLQYTLLGIIPIIILNKLIAQYVPEADEKKGTLEISAEVVIQILVMIFGIFFINRLITYVPTYSGEDYESINLGSGILVFLMIIISFQSRLGEKVNILMDRLYQLWDGSANQATPKDVKVKQPVSGQVPVTISSQAQNSVSLTPQYNDGTSINSLPNQGPRQHLPDYNQMYQQDNTPLVNAQTPGIEGFGGDLMAANEALGGSFGSAW